MDPVSLVLTALASGAAQGATDSARDAAEAAYAKLARLVTVRLAGGRSWEVALAEHAADPQTWRAPLAKALADCGAGGDRAIIEAAQELMGLLGRAGSKQAGHQVGLHSAHVVQVGDDNEQFNTFNTFNTVMSTFAMPPEAIYKSTRPTLNPPADEPRHNVGFAEAPRSGLSFPRPDADVPQASPAGIPLLSAKQQGELADAIFEEWKRSAGPSS